jgi:hypothetical protein
LGAICPLAPRLTFFLGLCLPSIQSSDNYIGLQVYPIMVVLGTAVGLVFYFGGRKLTHPDVNFRPSTRESLFKDKMQVCVRACVRVSAWAIVQQCLPVLFAAGFYIWPFSPSVIPFQEESEVYFESSDNTRTIVDGISNANPLIFAKFKQRPDESDLKKMKGDL